MLSVGSISTLSRKFQLHQKLFAPSSSIFVRNVRSKPSGLKQTVLQKVPALYIARDSQSMAELLVKTTDDNHLPQMLTMLQQLRKTSLSNKSINKALTMAGFDWQHVPVWFQDWLKGSLSVAEKFDPFPFALPKPSKEETDKIVAEMGVYLFCIRNQKSSCFADFLLKHMVDTKTSNNPSLFTNIAYKRIQFSMYLASSLTKDLDMCKLNVVLDILRKYHRRELLREQVVSTLTSHLSLHVDLLQPLYEHILGERKRELGIFTYAKKYNRAQIIRGLTHEINMIMVRRQQADIDRNVADERFELPVDVFLSKLSPDYKTAASASSSASSSSAIDTLSVHDVIKPLTPGMKKHFNFLQQRIYIGIHHVFQLNLRCMRTLPSSQLPSPPPPLHTTAASTLLPLETPTHDMSVLQTASAEAIAKAMQALDGTQQILTTGIRTEDYLSEVSKTENEEIAININANPMTSLENSSASYDEMNAQLKNNSQQSWMYSKLSPESIDERFNARSKEYTTILQQWEEDDNLSTGNKNNDSKSNGNNNNSNSNSNSDQRDKKSSVNPASTMSAPVPSADADTIAVTESEEELQAKQLLAEQLQAQLLAQQQEEINKMAAEIVKRDPDASSARKAVLLNLPSDVTEEDVRSALRNVGAVKKVWIYAHDFVAGPSDTSSASKKHTSETTTASSGAQQQGKTARKKSNDDDTDEELVDVDDEDIPEEEVEEEDVEFGAAAANEAGEEDSEVEEDEEGFVGVRDGTHEQENDPLNMFTTETAAHAGAATDSSSKKAAVKKRRPMVRRKIVERMRMLGKERDVSDTYAFVQMEDDEGYARLTSDMIRIFGVSIKKHSCKSITADRLNYFFVEIHYPMRISNIIHTINMMLSKDYKVSFERPIADDRIKPVFLKLKFRNHEECWEAFHMLGNNPVIHKSVVTHPELPANDLVNFRGGSQSSANVAWHLCWMRTRNYWELSMRARRSLEGLEYKYLRETSPHDSTDAHNTNNTNSNDNNTIDSTIIIQEAMSGGTTQHDHKSTATSGDGEITVGDPTHHHKTATSVADTNSSSSSTTSSEAATSDNNVRDSKREKPHAKKSDFAEKLAQRRLQQEKARIERESFFPKDYSFADDHHDDEPDTDHDHTNKVKKDSKNTKKTAPNHIDMLQPFMDVETQENLFADPPAAAVSAAVVAKPSSSSASSRKVVKDTTATSPVNKLSKSNSAIMEESTKKAVRVTRRRA